MIGYTLTWYFPTVYVVTTSDVAAVREELQSYRKRTPRPTNVGSPPYIIQTVQHVQMLWMHQFCTVEGRTTAVIQIQVFLLCFGPCLLYLYPQRINTQKFHLELLFIYIDTYIWSLQCATKTIYTLLLNYDQYIYKMHQKPKIK